MTSKQAIVGLVASQRQAERLLTALEGAGLSKDDVSVLLLAEARRDAQEHEPMRGPATAMAGGSTRSSPGGALALRVSVGIVVIPGAGPFIAAGPLLEVLSRELAGAGSRSIVAALVGMGIHEREAQQYERAILGGRVLVSVHVDEHEERALAKAILMEGRAAHVSSVGEHDVSKQAPASTLNPAS
jgi:hypothetical protein